MPRRERPPVARRSEGLLRVVVNDQQHLLNEKIAAEFGWKHEESIRWLSPVKDDQYAEYFDQEFLDRLDIKNLSVSLADFWPASGPRWDGLAKTESGKVILVEAKAYIEESVDYVSRASNPDSIAQISESLAAAKKEFRARPDAPWESPFYQTANRLAHLYFLRTQNDVDAWMLFLNFANAPDVPQPATCEQWEGAIRLTKKCLGLGTNSLERRIGELIWDCSTFPV